MHQAMEPTLNTNWSDKLIQQLLSQGLRDIPQRLEINKPTKEVEGEIKRVKWIVQEAI